MSRCGSPHCSWVQRFVLGSSPIAFYMLVNNGSYHVQGKGPFFKSKHLVQGVADRIGIQSACGNSISEKN